MRPDKTENEKPARLVGRTPPSHRVAAAGGRQISALFVSFVSFVVHALGGSSDMRDLMLVAHLQTRVI